jgi:hypothetical protein
MNPTRATIFTVAACAALSGFGLAWTQLPDSQRLDSPPVSSQCPGAGETADLVCPFLRERAGDAGLDGGGSADPAVCPYGGKSADAGVCPYSGRSADGAVCPYGGSSADAAATCPYPGKSRTERDPAAKGARGDARSV